MSLTTQSNPLYDKLQIVKTGTTETGEVSSFSASAGTWSIRHSQVIIPHNLGFRPISIAYLDLGGIYTALPLTYVSSEITNSSTWFSTTIQIGTDLTNFYVDVWMSTFGGSTGLTPLPVKYYLLKELAV